MLVLVGLVQLNDIEERVNTFNQEIGQDDKRRIGVLDCLLKLVGSQEVMNQQSTVREVAPQAIVVSRIVSAKCIMELTQ